MWFLFINPKLNFIAFFFLVDGSWNRTFTFMTPSENNSRY